MANALLLLLTSALILWGNNAAQAQNIPIPAKKTKALEALKERAEDQKKEKSQLQKKVESVQKNLDNTKQNMIDTAAKIQEHERSLKQLEKRIANLEIKRSVLQDKLYADRESISKLILALVHIRKTPPEAMLASPEKPHKIAQGALLMGDIVPSINRHAENLNNNLETLNQVTKDLKREKSSLLKESDDLREKQDELTDMIKNRQNLFAKLNDDIKARELSIQKISLQAKDLEQLVKRLKKQEKQEKERKTLVKKIRPKPQTPIVDDGDARMPISGIIRTGYNKKDNVGAKSKGLSIEGRAGSLVVAPLNGKIQFTGSFKRYGNIIIIEHADGYHSLVSGLDTISTSVGDVVKTGEPIGTLPNSSLIPRPTLYYELRRKGKPVDPAKKFSDLG